MHLSLQSTTNTKVRWVQNYCLSKKEIFIGDFPLEILAEAVTGDTELNFLLSDIILASFNQNGYLCLLSSCHGECSFFDILNEKILIVFSCEYQKKTGFIFSYSFKGGGNPFLLIKRHMFDMLNGCFNSQLFSRDFTLQIKPC